MLHLLGHLGDLCLVLLDINVVCFDEGEVLSKLLLHVGVVLKGLIQLSLKLLLLLEQGVLPVQT